MPEIDVASIIEGLPSRAAKIRALAEQGLTKKEIAEVLECTTQQVYSALRRGSGRGNARAQVEPIDLSPEQKAAIEALPTNAAKARYLGSLGYTTSQIAKTLDIQYQQVYRALHSKKASAEEEAI